MWVVRQKRRRSAAGAGLGALLLFVVGCGEPAPPDVVVLVIDTLRADHVGAWGHVPPTTPFIDELAGRSVLFEQAIAPAPWTLPSAVSLLTSTLPCEHGVVKDGEVLRSEIAPLAERLRAAGYFTGSLVENGYAGSASGLDRGLDVYASLMPVSAKTVRSFLEGRPQDRPFFLYLHIVDPHDAYLAPDETVAAFGDVPQETRERVRRALRRYRRLSKVDFAAGRPPGSTDNAAAQRRIREKLRALADPIRVLYDADIRTADEKVAAFVAQLREHDAWENTLFVLTSDHGEEFDDHGGWQHDQSLHEELIHVPFLMRLPGDEAAGTRVREPVSLLDLLPTLAERLGRPELAAGARGRSLLPLIRGEGTSGEARVVAERRNEKKWYGPEQAGRRGDHNVAVRDGAWKAIWNVDRETLELYDLSQDPEERHDLRADEPERAEALAARAREWLSRCGDPAAPTPQRPLDEAAKEQLRALGYLE